MTRPRLTEAQERALAWLPRSGDWRDQPGRMTAALNSLSRAGNHVVEMQWIEPGNWRSGSRWRLTATGLATFHGEKDRADG